MRADDMHLRTKLETGKIFIHPFIIGELSLGSLRKRTVVLNYLNDLPQAIVADNAEVMEFIEKYYLFGLGIGYIDAHLLASARLTSIPLWTRDNRLHEAATKLGVSYTHK